MLTRQTTGPGELAGRREWIGLALLAVAVGAQTAAGQTLAGAAAASTHLPAGAAAGLLDTARAAFTSGLHVTGVVAAVIFAALALLIAAARPGRAAAEAPAAAADEAFEGAQS